MYNIKEGGIVMKITEIHVSVSFTKNLGNYESLKIEAGATSEIEQGEKVKSVFSDTFKLVKEEIKKQVEQTKFK